MSRCRPTRTTTTFIAPASEDRGLLTASRKREVGETSTEPYCGSCQAQRDRLYVSRGSLVPFALCSSSPSPLEVRPVNLSRFSTVHVKRTNNLYKRDTCIGTVGSMVFYISHGCAYWNLPSIFAFCCLCFFSLKNLSYSLQCN